MAGKALQRQGASTPTKKSGAVGIERNANKHDVQLARMQYRLDAMRTDNRYKLASRTVYMAGIVGCAGLAYLSIASLAGTTTTVTAVVSAIANLNMNEYFAYGLAALFGTAFFAERKTRKRTIHETRTHIENLEKRLAPDRESSGLLPDGTPSKEDKDG
jgi:hypothetical protein